MNTYIFAFIFVLFLSKLHLFGGYYNIIIHVPLLILLPPEESVKTTNELHSSSLFILWRTLKRIGWNDVYSTYAMLLLLRRSRCDDLYYKQRKHLKRMYVGCVCPCVCPCVCVCLFERGYTLFGYFFVLKTFADRPKVVSEVNGGFVLA